MRYLNQIVRTYLIYLILLMAFLALVYRIDKPFIGHHDWNGAFWGTITLNYVGHLQKFLGQAPIFDGVNDGNPVYYSDYPPLMPVLFAVSSLVFGVNEASMRFVTVFFSLILIFTIYKIGVLLFSKEVGLVAAIFATLTPMLLYFGKLPDHEPIVTSLMTVTIYWYLRQKAGGRHNYFLFLTFFALSLAESWAIYFLLPFLWLDSRVFSKQKRLAFRPLFIVMGIVVSCHLLLINHVNGIQGITVFFRSGLSRFNGQSIKSIITFTTSQFFITLARYSVIYYTRVLLTFTGLWCLRFAWLTVKRRAHAQDTTLLLFLLPQLSFVLTFKSLVYIHDYKLYLVLPFIVLTAAVITIQFIRKLTQIFKTRFLSLRLSQAAAQAILLGIIVLAATERLPFLTTLLATSFNQPGVELGKLLAAKTVPTDTTFIDSGQFMSFYDVFVRYYANRHVVGGDITLSDFTQHPESYSNYRYIVLIEERTTAADLAEYLNKNYLSQKYGNYTLFDLTSLPKPL